MVSYSPWFFIVKFTLFSLSNKSFSVFVSESTFLLVTKLISFYSPRFLFLKKSPPEVERDPPAHSSDPSRGLRPWSMAIYPGMNDIWMMQIWETWSFIHRPDPNLKYGSFDLDNDCLFSMAMRLESQILFQKSKLDSKWLINTFLIAIRINQIVNELYLAINKLLGHLPSLWSNWY